MYVCMYKGVDSSGWRYQVLDTGQVHCYGHFHIPLHQVHTDIHTYIGHNSILPTYLPIVYIHTYIYILSETMQTPIDMFLSCASGTLTWRQQRFIHTCFRYINTYIHKSWTKVHTYIHTCIHPHTCIHAIYKPSIRLFIHTYIHTYFYSLKYTYISYIHTCRWRRCLSYSTFWMRLTRARMPWPGSSSSNWCRALLLLVHVHTCIHTYLLCKKFPIISRVCMYVCMYVCMVCMNSCCLCMYACMHISAQDLPCMYEFMYICMCLWISAYVCMYVCM